MVLGYLRVLFGALLAVAMIVSVPAQAAKIYIESKPGDVTAEQRAKVEKPRPVQLIFQFTTDQKANAKATKYLKEQVFKLVRESGAFSEVVETPVDGGAMLAITMDNIVQKDAAGKGFVTGLTFGLAKTVVRDGYLIVAEYNAAAGAPPIRREVAHGMWLTMGTKEAPGTDLIPVKNAITGIETIVRQGIGHAVNQIAQDPAFAGAAPTDPSATAPVRPGA